MTCSWVAVQLPSFLTGCPSAVLCCAVLCCAVLCCSSAIVCSSTDYMLSSKTQAVELHIGAEEYKCTQSCEDQTELCQHTCASTHVTKTANPCCVFGQPHSFSTRRNLALRLRGLTCNSSAPAVWTTTVTHHLHACTFKTCITFCVVPNLTN